MNRKYYAKDDPRFAAVISGYPHFRPRWRLLLTEREAEQDAYFWFLAGQRQAREEVLEEQGLGAFNEKIREVERCAGIRK